MKAAGGVVLAVTATAFCLFAGPAAGQRSRQERATVITDGRLRPGHLETIQVAGFPGKGMTEISFFPTAICEDKCGARSFRGDRTDAKGAAKFRVRVPGTFIDQRNRSAYFRDGERIEVNVVWEGPDDSFNVATAEPDPIFVRAHASDHD
jgi:hypothetical protein